MRIALDSSVLIAAHISRAGVCAELLEDLLLHHELVTSEFILEELGRKLLDIPVLGTAVGGECALLVSVDRDLLDMQRINEIPIIRPGEYWRRTTEGR